MVHENIHQRYFLGKKNKKTLETFFTGIYRKMLSEESRDEEILRYLSCSSLAFPIRTCGDSHAGESEGYSLVN